MSNETSASETTPLRPESENNLTAATTFSGNVATNRSIPFNTNLLNSYNNNQRGGSSNNNSAIEKIPPKAAATKVSISSNYPNNNKIIEVHLSHNNYNSKNNNNSHRAMDTNKRILLRVGLDILILICVGVPILLFFVYGRPFERGFFCNDESLKHPYKPSTITNWMLYVIGLVIPVGTIFAVEIFISKQAAASSDNITTRRYVFMGYEIPDWLVECYKKIGVFGFGAAVAQLTTDIAKYSIGRLRPHFFTVCQPIMLDSTTCADTINIGKYIQDFECQGDGSSKRMLKDMRLSFPSGHSSFTFYAMVFLALYLQARIKWRGSKLLRHLLQFIFIMIAWFTALSRVSDYKHHPTDVLAGATIGSLVALIMVNFVSDLFDKKLNKSYVLPRTTHDLHSQTLTTTTNDD